MLYVVSRDMPAPRGARFKLLEACDVSRGDRGDGLPECGGAGQRTMEHYHKKETRTISEQDSFCVEAASYSALCTANSRAYFERLGPTQAGYQPMRPIFGTPSADRRPARMADLKKQELEVVSQ